jgi:betaine-aldehyde dehydrogenase
MGQSCIAGSRLLVHESVQEPLMARIVERARALRLGPPEAATTELGPLASFAHRDRVQAMVDEGVRAGARVLAGGGRPEGAAFARGAYFQPTVLAGLDSQAPTVRNEIFGPVLCVLPFGSDEELVAAADDSEYGLACGIWTREFHRAWAVARRVRAGTVWINTYRQNSVATPFGGYKASGLGRERGVQGLRQYQQVKSVFIGASATPMSIDR